MNRKMLTKSFVTATLIGIGTIAPNALAVSTTIPAALGHPFVAGAMGFSVFDNYVQSNWANSYWATPLVLSNFTSGDITLIQYARSCSPHVETALFTFDKFGAVSDWTSFVVASDSSTVGTATVPSNGSAFAKTFLRSEVDACSGGLAQVRVTW